MAIYKLFWDDYCSWYLELVKPAYGAAIDGRTYKATVEFFEKLLKLIHPIMPFITEELWQAMEDRAEGATIMFQSTPKAGAYDAGFLAEFEVAREAVIGVRAVRAQKQISPKEGLKLFAEGTFPAELYPAVRKLANVTDIAAGSADGTSTSFIVGTVNFSVPLEGLVNAGEEKGKLLKDLEYQKKFLAGVRAKLANANFVAHAPEAVIAGERKKEADALARIEAIESTLSKL